MASALDRLVTTPAISQACAAAWASTSRPIRPYPISRTRVMTALRDVA
jgi:hypothetical protein